MAESNIPFPLAIRLFGPLDVRLRGEPLPPLRSRRGLWLLALLALRLDREVERAWLAGILWPDSDEPQALASLRRTLTDLRQAMGDQAEKLRSPTPRTLRLALAESHVDVHSFDAAIAEGSEQALGDAVALYRGRLLEGCAEEWVLPEREARTQAYIAALETLAGRAMERRDFEQAAQFFRLVTREDALREAAQRGLMHALAEGGNLTAATQSFRDFRLLLRRELNTDPDPETTALYQRLRETSRRRALLPPPLPVAREPQAHRSVLHALPTPLTRFVGRDQAIRDILLCLERARLVSLCGTGGIGKTRLALRVAEEIAEEFCDGVWFADLSSLMNPDLVPQAVASLLQVREQAGRPLLETLSDALRAKSLLLVLDNCEHLGKACSTLAEMLLQRCPSLRILTTTRQPLGVAGEMVWRVPPLSLPEREKLQGDGITPEELLASSEAIRLFVDRATAAMPTFVLTPRSARATAQICRRLDGIPLALELAAARVKILSVEQIARRLQDRFRLLTEGSRMASPRQQTLRAAIDWSYALLSEQERSLFARLAIFAGGWTLEAAEAICAEELRTEEAEPADSNASVEGDDVLDLLAQLADRSLIVVQGSEEGAMRHSMMETIRQYALERLRAAGGEEILRERHRIYYLSIAELAEENLVGPEQAVWLERLEQEHENLRAVLTWSVDAETRVRLAGAMWRFWWVRGYYMEGRAWLSAALTHRNNVPLLLRAKALAGAAVLASDQNDFLAARAYFEENRLIPAAILRLSWRL